MADYVETSDLGFVNQLNNFANKLPSYLGTFSLDASVATQVQDDANFMAYVQSKLQESVTYGQDWTKLKNQVRNAEGGDVLGPFPAAPDVSTPPTAVEPGVEKRYRALGNQLKAHANWTTGIGETLGLIAPETDPDFENYKPVFTIQIVADQPLIKWKKLQSDGVKIYKSVDGGQWVYLDKDTSPNFLDKSPSPPAGTVQQWKYKLVYVVNDEEIGEFSDEVVVSVVGEV